MHNEADFGHRKIIGFTGINPIFKQTLPIVRSINTDIYFYGGIVMKILKRTTFRAVIALFLMVMAGGFLWVGVPALAADLDMTAVVAENSKPIAKNLDYSTYKGIAVKGQFSATDPEGDSVTFEVSELPKKGAITPENDGSFVYTPNDGKNGRDSFSYIAVDAVGNISEKALVTITINKQSTKLSYADMSGNSSYYSALVLAEKGILTGEKIGNEYFFRPDRTVTRGEFLTMCLDLNNTETLQGITRTGFYDDETIPMWAKPYVSTALMSGIITGFKNDEGRLVFASQEPVTYAEAAVILNKMLKISDVTSVSSITDEACPVWARQAKNNLAACNILPVLGQEAYSGSVTRAEAADMLVSAMQLLDARKHDSSLLSWLN